MVKAILKLLAKSKPASDKIKIYRGEYLPENKPFTVKKKGSDFEHLRNRAAGNTGPKPTNVATFSKRKKMSSGGLV